MTRNANLILIVSLPRSQRTHVPTAQLVMPLSTFLHQARPNAPLLSFLERRSLSARFPSSLPASLSQLARRPRVLPAEARVSLVARAVAAELQVVAVDVAVDVEAAPVVVDV
jgi:hypothetical protein